MKEIFVVCGCYPDQGKGVVTAALSYTINQSGYDSLPFKYDGYLNHSSGEMNPLDKDEKIVYQGEEVFVLGDGLESEADFGTYERFTGKKLGAWDCAIAGELLFNTITDATIPSGKVLTYIDTLKKCEKWIMETVKRTDFPIIEVGGTIGDPEQGLFFKALNRATITRGIKYKLILLAPFMRTVGDTDSSSMLSFRTKVTRNALAFLENSGLFASVLACNSPDGTFGNIDIDRIVSDYPYLSRKVLNLKWRECVYEKVKDALLLLNAIEPKLTKRFKSGRLEKYVKSKNSSKDRISICIIGDTVSNDTYRSLIESLEHASFKLGVRPSIEWMKTKPSKKYDLYVVTDNYGVRTIGNVNNVKSMLVVGKGFGPYLDAIGAVVEMGKGVQNGSVEFTLDISGRAGRALHKSSSEIPTISCRFRHAPIMKSMNIDALMHMKNISVDFAKDKNGNIVGLRIIGNKRIHTAIGGHPEYDSIPGIPSQIILKQIKDTLNMVDQ